MSKLTVKSGKGELTLRKSSRLVGVKAAPKKDVLKNENISRKVLPRLGGFQILELENKPSQSADSQLDEIRNNDDVNVGTHVYYAEGSTRPLVPTGEIYIIFEVGVSEGEQQLVLDEYNLKLVERRGDDRMIAKVSENSPNPVKVANFIQRTSLVKLAEPDLDTLVDEYFSEPQDELLSHQWHLKNKGFIVDSNRRIKEGADAKVIDAWNRLGNAGDNSIVIAVIDNGFDLTHPDLKDKIVKPYDLWTQSTELIQGDPTFTHGTPCASVALAASNGSGIVGAAPNAKFMPISGTSFSLRATEEMYNYVIDNGADIVSCSWGSTDPFFDLNPMKEAAISKATREGRNGKGCVVIYAVGNENQDFVSFYAAHPDVIAVAACTSQDEHASYSNRGREVTVCAPSNGDWPILAARAWWDEGVPWEVGEKRYWRDGVSRGDRYKHFGGTSSACPLVAGVCALMLSANPALTAKEVKEILQQTADKIGHPSEYVNGHSVKYGAGRVNADKAVAEAIRRRDGDLPPPPVVENEIATGRGLFRFSVVRQESRGFGVQIGVFAEYGNVLIQAEKLEKAFGQPVVVNINQLEGRTIYRVVIGAFDSINSARMLQQQMRTAGVRGFIKNLEELK